MKIWLPTEKVPVLYKVVYCIEYLGKRSVGGQEYHGFKKRCKARCLHPSEPIQESCGIIHLQRRHPEWKYARFTELRAMPAHCRDCWFAPPAENNVVRLIWYHDDSIYFGEGETRRSWDSVPAFIREMGDRMKDPRDNVHLYKFYLKYASKRPEWWLEAYMGGAR